MAEEIRLSLPARPAMLRIVRMTTAALAAEHGFDYDEIEDLKLAIDELCHALLLDEGDAGQPLLHLVFETSGDGGLIEISGTVGGPSLEDASLEDPSLEDPSLGGPSLGGAAPRALEPLGELPRLLLAALVERYDFTAADRSFHLQKTAKLSRHATDADQ